MLNPTSKRDLTLALLMTVGIHVGFFFAAAAAVANDLIKGKIEPKEKKEKKKQPAPMKMVYEDEFFALPEVEPERDEPEPVVAVTPPAPAEEEKVEEAKLEEDQEPSFVQTREDQEVEEAPEDSNFIGERNTKATSDEGAKAGDEKMAALAGEEKRKHDPKTFDSQFSKGDQSGQSEGNETSFEKGAGHDQVNQEMADGTTSETPDFVEPSPAIEETQPAPKPEKLPTIDNALAALEEETAKEPAMEDAKTPMVPEVKQPKPQPAASERRVAANQNGGFAPLTRKTQVAGVLSANGGGSLNVAKTAVGRYKALILKRLESPWRMRTIRRRSTLFPGSITLYFMVDRSGNVSNRRQVAMVGASDLQWGIILNALSEVNLPKMPKDVVKELDGKALEMIVTFNY